MTPLTGLTGEVFCMLKDLMTRLASEDDGATAVEYGLMVALIAVAIMATVGLVGDRLVAMYQTVAGAL